MSGLPSPLSPGVYAVHTGDNPLFEAGAADRGEGLASLAEDGIAGTLAEALDGAAGIEGSGVFSTPGGAPEPGPLMPGDSYVFEVEAMPGDRLSFASMFVESNDAFIAPDGSGIALFDGDGMPVSGDVTDQVVLWDVGSEKDEGPGHGPTQKPRQAAGAVDVGAAEGVASLRVDTTRALPIAQGIAEFSVSESDGAFTVEITNVSVDRGGITTPLSPFLAATHNDTFTLFESGAVAPTGLEELAEDGDLSPMETDLSGNPAVDGVAALGSGLIQPGDTLTFMVAPTEDAPMMSLASMVVVSNDVFLSTPPEGVALMDANGVRPAADVEAELNRRIANWDAGTEANEVPGAGANTGMNQDFPGQGPADEDTAVRRYADSTNDLAGASLGGFLSVTIKHPPGSFFDITIANTSGGTAYLGAIPPVVYAVHNDQFSLFEMGSPVSAGLESLAEDGETATLTTEWESDPNVQAGQFGATSEVLFDGDSITFSVTPFSDKRFLSVASAIVPSNDTFFALGETGIALLDENGDARSEDDIAADVESLLAAYDAGTEANQAGGAGPDMLPLQTEPDTGAADGNGLVRALPGPVWTFPAVSSVVRVTITPQQPQKLN